MRKFLEHYNTHRSALEPNEASLGSFLSSLSDELLAELTLHFDSLVASRLAPANMRALKALAQQLSDDCPCSEPLSTQEAVFALMNGVRTARFARLNLVVTDLKALTMCFSPVATPTSEAAKVLGGATQARNFALH